MLKIRVSLQGTVELREIKCNIWQKEFISTSLKCSFCKTNSNQFDFQFFFSLYWNIYLTSKYDYIVQKYWVKWNNFLKELKSHKMQYLSQIIQVLFLHLLKEFKIHYKCIICQDKSRDMGKNIQILFFQFCWFCKKILKIMHTILHQFS